MASVRMIKKDIDYLVSEVISDCYMTLYFHPGKRDGVLAVMQQAVDLRNKLISAANNPAEKNNPSLVKKHYAHIRRELMQTIDELFSKLSEVCKQK